MPAYNPAQLLRALHAQGVEFVVIGQTAAVLHGAPGITQDVDIVLHVTVDNAERLVEALLSIGGSRVTEGTGTGEGAPPDERDVLGHQPTRYVTAFGVLDVLPFVKGVGDYGRVRERAARVDVEGFEVLVAELEDIIASKEALGRSKDRAQLPALYATLNVLRAEQGQ
jgi:hypothetical protein